MPLQEFTEECKAEVTVVEARKKDLTWKDSEDGDFQVQLKCVTEDEYYGYYELNWTKKVISGESKYKGMMTYEASVDKLREIGVEDGFLGNLDTAIKDGLRCMATVKRDTWTAKDGSSRSAIRIKYLNPMPNTMDMKDVDVDELLANFTAGTKQPMKPIADRKLFNDKKEEEIPDDFKEIPPPLNDEVVQPEVMDDDDNNIPF